MILKLFHLAVVLGVLGFHSPAVAHAEDARRVEELERAVEELRSEVERLKQDAPEVNDSPTTLEAIARRVEIGGYGSIRFEESSADDTNTTFTFRRFVLTADAAPAPKMRFYLELELERFRKLELERKAVPDAGGLKVEQEVEGTNESEIALEQAWLELAFWDSFRLRAGGVLVPLGRFNLDHDDNRWDLPRRSLVDRGAPVLPSKAAWDELGVGFTGALEVGENAVRYHAYVVNGVTLEPEVEEVIQTRDGRRDKLELEAKFSPTTGTFGNDVKDAKAVTGRLAWSPSLGHELAGSFYWGRYTPDFLPSEAITAAAFDGLTTWGPFELEGEWVYTDFGDVDRVARGFASRALRSSNATPSEASPEFESEIEFEIDSLSESRHGYWLEGRWRFRPSWLRESAIGRPFEDPVLTAVVRAEQVWINDRLFDLEISDGLVTASSSTDHRLDRWSVGGSYRPVPLVAFQIAYEFTHVDEGGLDDVTNFIPSPDDDSHAVLIGATFGF